MEWDITKANAKLSTSVLTLFWSKCIAIESDLSKWSCNGIVDCICNMKCFIYILTWLGIAIANLITHYGRTRMKDANSSRTVLDCHRRLSCIVAYSFVVFYLVAALNLGLIKQTQTVHNQSTDNRSLKQWFFHTGFHRASDFLWLQKRLCKSAAVMCCFNYSTTAAGGSSNFCYAFMCA